MKYEEIIHNIQRHIEQQGMKQCVVAQRAGFTPQAFNNILSNRKLLRVEHLPSIAHALGVEVGELFYPQSEEETVGTFKQTERRQTNIQT